MAKKFGINATPERVVITTEENERFEIVPSKDGIIITNITSMSSSVMVKPLSGVSIEIS